jgi:3-polyprenyl-4-hydroxybenzoate decarboxylase
LIGRSKKISATIGWVSETDILDDRGVFWPMATRMQADEDIDVIRNAMGAILDPSNHACMTAKMIIDATRPSANFPSAMRCPWMRSGAPRGCSRRHSADRGDGGDRFFEFTPHYYRCPT